MKRLLLALLLCAAPLAITQTGCKTSQQTAVFKTLASVEASVDSSYKAYLDLVVKGTVATTNVKAISADYALFQSMMTDAITASQGNTLAIASQALLDAATKILNEIVVAKGAVK